MDAPRIVFLDDDPVVRILRLVLDGREGDPWIEEFFAPERVDIAPLVQAARGLRARDGARISLAAEHPGHLRDADIVVFRRGEISAGLMRSATSLKLVQRLGERAHGIDLAAAREQGVKVSCMPRRTLHFTAEHSLLLMMALAKRLLAGDSAVRRGVGGPAGVPPGDAPAVAYNWAGIPGVTGLHGSTLGIVGLGEVGSLVARLARGFGMTVLYTKPRRAAAETEAALGVEYAGLDELLARADHVSLNAADVPENRGMANADFFARMKRSACFINTSRGRLVDEDALFRALDDGLIAGAGLDVHAVEPRPPGDRFGALPNVVLTPHYAGGARGGLLREFERMAGNCLAVMRGGGITDEVTA